MYYLTDEKYCDLHCFASDGSFCPHRDQLHGDIRTRKHRGPPWCRESRSPRIVSSVWSLKHFSNLHTEENINNYFTHPKLLPNFSYFLIAEKIWVCNKHTTTTITIIVATATATTVKPDLTTTCEQRPPVNNGQFESSTASLNLSFIRHLCLTAIFFRPQGWPLYTGLTVLTNYIHWSIKQGE